MQVNSAIDGARWSFHGDAPLLITASLRMGRNLTATMNRVSPGHSSSWNQLKQTTPINIKQLEQQNSPLSLRKGDPSLIRFWKAATVTGWCGGTRRARKWEYISRSASLRFVLSSRSHEVLQSFFTVTGERYTWWSYAIWVCRRSQDGSMALGVTYYSQPPLQILIMFM